MKRTLIILIAVFSAQFLFPQVYYKFPTADAIWNYKIAGSMSYPYEWPVIDSLGQKTTIGSFQYIEIYSAARGVSDLIGAIREDTLLKKVYFHNFSNEIVLYDFSLNVGDTIYYSTNLYYSLDYYKVVNNIDSISINGQFRKRWYLTNSYMGMPDTWIEGIGSVYRYGLLYPILPDIVTDASTPYFGCFTDETIVYLEGSNCIGTCPCTTWLVDIKDINHNENDIKLYPNPIRNKLNVEILNNRFAFFNLEIYTYNSVLIQKLDITSKKNIEIDLSFLPRGIYFIKLTGKDNITYRKFIK